MGLLMYVIIVVTAIFLQLYRFNMENQTEMLSTMYLSTIPNVKRKFTTARSALDTSDIQGARSRYI